MENFSYLYLAVRDNLPLIREKGKDKYGKKISERLVRCIWLDQLFKDEIFTIDGRKIKVLSPGWWNFEGGPDFRKAVITVNGDKTVKGDVEVHVRSSDWKKHGHHRDERYKNVIAHVFMWNDLKSTDSSILQVEILKFLKEDIDIIEDMIDMTDYPHKSPKEYGDCSSISVENIGRLLDTAGDARVIEKAERFKKSLHGDNWDQLLYEGIMESLGYRRNKQQFKSLARAITLQMIKDAVKASYESRITTIQSLLMGGGGLIPQNPHSPPFHKGGKWGDYTQEVKIYIKRLAKIRNKYKIPPAKIIWDFYGTRPANLPFRRIAGISHFLSANLEKGLVNVFISEFLKSPISPFAKGGVRRIRDFIKKIDALFAIYDDFWSFRYTFKGRRFSDKMRLIGQDRVLTIIVDVLIPIIFLYSRENRHFQLEEIAHSIYSEISRLPSNSIIRFMEKRLLKGKRHIIDSARRGQALIQIFNDYCANNEDGCFGCTLKAETEKNI